MALCGLYRVENTGVTSQSINVTTCESGGACITGFTLDPGQILLVNYFSISSSDPDIVITTVYGGVTPYYTSFSSDCDSSAFYIVTDSSGSVFSSMTHTHYCFPTILPCDTGDKPVLSGCYKKMSTSGSLPAITYIQYSAVEYPITSGTTAPECTSVCSCAPFPCENDYCISYTDTSYDGNYTFAGSYSGNSYWTGDTTPTYYIFNNGDEWCLSDSLGGTCLLSGKSPCLSTCPDLCDSFFSSGVCSTTTTTTSPCNVFDFNAIFECNITPTPSVTPTQTPTPTVTPTPTSSPYSIGLGARLFSEPASATPTSTPTPTPTPVIERPCNFSGDVTYTTFDSIVNCSNSFQFQDCINGAMYFSSKPVKTPDNIRLEKFMIFSALVGGIPKCISYLGTDIQVIGVDEIDLIAGPIGYSNVGDCVRCLPPTPTPSPSPPACECPEGYTLLEDKVTCEKIETSQPKVPDKPLIIGNNYEAYPTGGIVGVQGLLVYENISNKEWPIMSCPQFQSVPNNASAPANSMSLIPLAGVTNKNNSYSSILPAPTLVTNQHGVIQYPNGFWPVPTWPPVDVPPNIPNLSTCFPWGSPQANLQILFESRVVSGVLQLASGNTVNIEYQRRNQPPTINSLWGITSSQSWLENVCIWNDSSTPGTGNPLENSWVGITQCIEITEEKTYYIIGTGNNALRIKIDGLLAVEMNSGDGAKGAFNFNNCFPVDLTVGTHVISMDVGNFGGGGNYAFEILDIPINDLLSATGYTADIAPHVIFSSKNRRPRSFAINFTSGSDIITSSGNFLPSDVSAFVKFSSFVPSNTYITQVINPNTAKISTNATNTGTGIPAPDPNGAPDGRIYFIFDTGQKFETTSNPGFICPERYIYSNCNGPECIKISRESCSTPISKT